MNKKLLLAVKRQILKEPKQVIMEHWILPNACRNPSGIAPHPIPNCGTAGCIAGWTLAKGQKWKKLSSLNSLHSEDWRTVRRQACKLLQIGERAGQSLFELTEWPGDFYFRYCTTKPQSKARVRVIADRIDRFIATNGGE